MTLTLSHTQQQRSCSPNMSFASYEVCRKILTVDLRLGKVKVPTPNSRMNHSDLENSWGIADIRSFKPCVTSFTLTRENVETLKILNTHETRKYYGFWYFYVKTASILKTFTLASKIMSVCKCIRDFLAFFLSSLRPWSLRCQLKTTHLKPRNWYKSCHHVAR